MTARIVFVICLVVAAGYALSACTVSRGSGNLVSEARPVGNFDRVVLSGFGSVVLTQGDEPSLVVETDSNIINHITTNVRGDTLYLGIRSPRLGFVAPTSLRYTLQVTDLTGLSVSGSGSIAADTLTTERLDVNISGSGDIRIGELTAGELDITTTGSGRVQVAGRAPRLTVDLSGSSDLNAGDLRSDTVDIRLTGSSSVRVWATESLEVDASGSASVSYYGNPSVRQSTSGSASLNSLGTK